MMGGNSQKEAKAEIEWSYAKEGIWLQLASDDQLNNYENESHTLVMGVYQLSETQSFYKLLADRPQISNDLLTGQTGKQVIQFDRYVLTPGKATVLKLDRAQGAKFIGMIAGYYDFNAVNAARLFRVPVNMQSEGMLSTTYKAEPAVLALRLIFGSTGINNAEVLTYDAEKKTVVEKLPMDSKNPEIKISSKEITQASDSQNAAMKLGN
jgi:type VI secretion system VasD/TssJ family lipoprotein